MCPLRELPENNETRLQFEALSAVIPLGEAHKQFCGDCPWSEQFDGLEDQERVAGVHEHQKLLSDMGFTIIVDETPRVLGDEQTWTGVDLRRAGTLLRSFDTEHAQALGEFVRTDLLDAVVEGSFDGLTPPDIGAYDIAEKLTRLKIAYNEELELRIESGTWDGTPPCFDALIAALAEIGVPPTACREVIAAPSTLAKCPHCGAPTTTHDGVRECVACFWEKARFDILPYENRDRTRALAYLQTDADPNVTENGLCYLSLPDPSSFPDSPLILDATATPEKIAGLYDVPVAVYGDERCELNANVVQIGNGAYHPGTIRGAFKDERRRLNDRLQQAIDVIVDRYEKPLFITKSDLLSLFNFPDHAKTRYYSGLRGLNLQECDAVICIGAPHPNIRNIENQARLLAMDHPDLEVGGDEHGTRDGAPNPPIYRKLYYADENGRGRAVPTKHFTGLAGKLFYEAREKELEQAVHRIRPLLADETKDIYLLTNVPTTLPVDEFVELDAISDEPLAAHLPVPGDVIPYLLKPLHNLSTDEDCDGVDVTDETISARISGLHTLARESGADWSETTAWRRVKKLEELGLINKPLYIRDRGYRYDIDRAAISRVLLVTSSTCEKAEAVSRFRSKTRAADGSLDWLDWAYDEFVDADTKFQKFC